MRITFLVPGRGLVGGIKVMGEYAGRLRARGHDVTIIYRRPARTLRGMLSRLWAGRPHDAIDESGCPQTAVREFTPESTPDGDIIITTGLRAVRSAAVFPARKGILVDIVQGTIHLEESPDEARETMAIAAHRVAVSDGVASYLRSHFGIEAPMVSNGVDHSQLYNPDRQFRTPRSIGMIHVAGPMKGTADGFEALRRVRDRWPDVRLAMYGAKRPKDALPRAEIYIQPKASRLRALYSSCDIWLAPSRSEGFGLPVLEAMACSVVPVATRAGGHESIVEDGKSGFLVPVGDVDAMVNRISMLLEDEPLLRKMSEAAYQRSLAFDWDKSTQGLEALFLKWTAGR